MEACIRHMSKLLLLMAVAMVTELAGSSLAATTPFRFPANLAEAFQVDGPSRPEEERGLPKATHATYRKDRTSAPTSGSDSTPGLTSGGKWRSESEPAAGRQRSDGKSQSYGTSWNNHYQSPTKSSSYDSRYDTPGKGDSNRYDDEGQRQYSYQDGDSDSDSYHSETPYGGGSYSGGTYHSGGGNHHGGKGNVHQGEGDHYGGGGSNGGGKNNYEDGYGNGGGDNYGGSRNHNDDDYGGGRNHNDEVTSYTRGENHYSGGGKNGYDSGDNGYDGGRNSYGGGGSHAGNDDGYGEQNHNGDYRRGGGHDGHNGHDGQDEHGYGLGYGGQDSGYEGSERGSSGQPEDPIDEYAVYNPKMSGTGRRRSDRGHGGYYSSSKNQSKSPPGGPFDRSDTRSVVYNGKRSDGSRDEEQRRGEGVDRKDDFTDFSGSRKPQSLLELINQRTEEAFSEPDSAAKNTKSAGKVVRGFTQFRGYRPAFDEHENYDGQQDNYDGQRDSETALRHGKDFEELRGSVGKFIGNAAGEDKSEHEPLRRPAGFNDFNEPEGLYDQPRYDTQKHLVHDTSKEIGGFHIPDDIFKDNAFVGQQDNAAPAKDHQMYGAYQANDDAFFNNGNDHRQPAQSDLKDPGSRFDIRANNMFVEIANPFQSHGPFDSEHVGEESSGGLQNSDSMPRRSRYQELVAMARESADLPAVPREGNNLTLSGTEKKFVHNRTRRNTSLSDDANVLSRSSEEISVRSSDKVHLRTFNANAPREVRPVIHRHFDGVPHMIHRDMGDEVFEKSKGESELPDSTHRDPRRIRGGFHGSLNPALRRPGRRAPPNFGGQRSRHGGAPLYPPLRGFASSPPVRHRQRQQNRGVSRPVFPSSGQPPLQRENSGLNGRPTTQSQREIFQHQIPSSQTTPFRPNLQHGQRRPPQHGLHHPTSLRHGAGSSPLLTSQGPPVQGHPGPFAKQHASITPFKNTNGGILETHQPQETNHFVDVLHPEANHFVDVQHPEHHETTTITSIINVQDKEPDNRVNDNLVDIDEGFDVFHVRQHSKSGLVRGVEFHDSITQASTIGETRREDKIISPGFKPGVLEHGFLPINSPEHHISRRELSDGVAKVDPLVAFNERSVDPDARSLTRDTRFLSAGFPDMPADLLKFQSDSLTDKPARQTKIISSSPIISTVQSKPLPSSHDLPSTTSNPATIPSSISVSPSEKAKRSNSAASSTDLLLAGSRRRAAYEPHYSSYKGRQGHRNYKTRQDPYQRYLSKEDENDPYFRYASRDNIQHSLASEVAPEEIGKRLERHREHDLYGREGTRRQDSGRRDRSRKSHVDDYDNDYVRERPRYDDEQQRSGHGQGYDADYVETYPDYADGTYRAEPTYSQGRQNDYNYDDGDYVSGDDYEDYGGRDDHHASVNHYHGDESSEGYHGDDNDGHHGDGDRQTDGTLRRNKNNDERYYDPAYQSGRYKDDVNRDYYGAQGDKRIRDIDGEIRDEAGHGYDDSRSTVSAMLDTIAEKRGDANCKEVAKDGMTCFQCTDAKGFQTEDCAYASNSKDPNNQRVSYSESSSYGDSKRGGHDKRGKLRRRPGKRHQRDGGNIYDIGYGSEYDGIEVDSDQGDTGDRAAIYAGDDTGDRAAIYAGEPDSVEGGTSPGRGQGFSGKDEKSVTLEEDTQRGRFQTPGAFKAGRFRDAYADRGHSRNRRHAGHRHVASANLTSKGSDRLTVQDDSYTGRALARFLSDEEQNHQVGPDSDSQLSQRYPGYHDNRPPVQRRSGGYHVRGQVPKYHRRVESSQSSGGGYDRYATGEPKRQPSQPTNDDEDYDDAGYGLGSDSGAIGDVFDYRFGRQPIDDRFVERLEKEQEDEEEPAEYDDEYHDSERPEYEDPDAKDYQEYDYDYPEQGQEYELEKPAQRSSSRPDGSSNRYSDYEQEPTTSLRRNSGRRSQRLRPFSKPRSLDDDRSDTYTSEDMQQENLENTDSAETGYKSAERNDRNGDNSDYDVDRAATYKNDERHERRPADTRNNGAKQRELARDMEPLNDEPAAYETHRYDEPDVTRSYEVTAQRRPSLTDSMGMPRGYLHSDSAPVSSRSEQGYMDGSGTNYDEPEGMSYDYARPETYERLNRGSKMTSQYREPGRDFFRSHPVGFEYFPTFDYVESDKKTN